MDDFVGWEVWVLLVGRAEIEFVSDSTKEKNESLSIIKFSKLDFVFFAIGEKMEESSAFKFCLFGSAGRLSGIWMCG